MVLMLRTAVNCGKSVAASIARLSTGLRSACYILVSRTACVAAQQNCCAASLCFLVLSARLLGVFPYGGNTCGQILFVLDYDFVFCFMLCF